MTDKIDLKKAILEPNGNLRAVDWAGAINLTDRNWGVTKQLGLFGERFGTQKRFFVTRSEDEARIVLEDRNYETTRPSFGREEFAGVEYRIPHFPSAHAIYPSDVDGLFDMGQFGAGSELAQVATVRDRIFKKIRGAHETTHELGRMRALVTGEVYAPKGTIKTSYGNTVNVYNEWGITRQSSALNLAPAANPLSSVSDLFGAMQDQSKEGDALDGYAVLCSKGLFNLLINHAYITDIYASAQLAGRQQLLVGRLPTVAALDARYRQFEYGNILFIEVGGNGPDGQPLIPANQGIAIPMGLEVGRMHFAPPSRFDTVNAVSQASYVWEKMGADQDKIEITAETNFAAVLDRPDLIRTVTATTA